MLFFKAFLARIWHNTLVKEALLIAETIVSAGLVGLILLQSKGTGLSASLGGGGEMYRSRRGVEKIVTIGTVVLATLFALFSIILLLIS